MSKPALERSRRIHRIGVLCALIVVATICAGCCWPCPDPALAFCGMAYLDANCNGVRDPDEAPLAGVCVWHSKSADEPTPSAEECARESHQTDTDGFVWWPSYGGALCKDVFWFAQAPDGYSPTTDMVVNHCDAEFGFAPDGTCPPHRSVTAQELVTLARVRCLAWAVGVPGVLVLLALGYWRFRRNAIARDQESSGE